MTIPAPTYRLPQQSIVSIEYPGPVASTPNSTDAAIRTLGGLTRITRALNKADGIVELNFRPDVTFSHAMGSETVDAGSMVVLKIVKRRRRKGKKSKIVGEELVEEAGIYKVEAVGSVSKVVRFRAMADLQYQPDNAEEDPTVQLANAMRNMDYKTLQEFRFPEPHEDFEHDLRLLPPPFMSRLALPQIYDFRANPLSAIVTTTKEDGTEVTRLVNKTKYKGELLITIPFDTPTEEIPQGPPEIPKGRGETKLGLESGVLAKLQKLMEERPVWSRAGLLNHLTKAERGRVQNYKIAIPSVCWSFSDGPFRESCIRFGYDPRLHREARFYQRVMIRNMQNKQYYMKKIVGASVAGKGELGIRESDGDSHIFNGQTVARNIGNYQLCDISDPYLAQLIQSEEYVREDCDYRDGWWDGEYFELIRQVLRRQFFSIVNDGIHLPDEAFSDLADHLDEYARLNGMGPYNRTGRMASQAPQQTEEGTPAVEEEGGAEAEGSVAQQQKRKSSSLKHIGKRMVKPKAKAISIEEMTRGRSRFGSTFDADHGSQAPASQLDSREDTVMEEQEEE